MEDIVEIKNYENYSDDEPVGIAAIENSNLPGSIESSLWDYIPQTIFHRLLSIAEAYKLHFGKRIDHVVDSIIDKIQCDTFEEELIFLTKTINDPALDISIRKILGKIEEVKYGNDLVLIISPP